MPEFIPVSIKMAKEQNLSLNPTKFQVFADDLCVVSKMKKRHMKI